jgi:hypothetical protein
MAGASFAAGIRITRGLLAPGGMLPQEELPSHVLVAFDLWFSELALAADPFGLLVSSLIALLLDARRRLRPIFTYDRG